MARALPGASPGSSGTRRLGAWRWALRAAALVTLLVLAVVALRNMKSLKRHGQNAFSSAYYGLDPLILGRSDADFPSPACCQGGACVPAGRRQRVALVTLLSSPDYLPLLRQLECTLRRSNPDVELVVLAREDAAGTAVRRALQRLNVTLFDAPELEYHNSYEPRYGRNWIKLAVWDMVQYDAVLLVDADASVVGDLSPLWTLPASFAGVWDQSRWLNHHRTVLRGLNGGVLFLRPCAAVARHMTELLTQHPKLRFTHGTAEQDFLTWYFRYTGITLPLEYNAQAAQSLVGNVTVGGASPVVVHFTEDKPFHGPQPDAPGHQFLCSLEELRKRSIAAGIT